MQAPSNQNEARAELEAVLKSGLFAHAPSLAQFLSYVCDRCLEGQSNQIKEYNIAVEALGRPQDFDQKRDTIVRVEAHRLRKRLREYYESDGADHAIRIEIPPGQYAPKFLPRGTPVPSLSANTLVVVQTDAVPDAVPVDAGSESLVPAR